MVGLELKTLASSVVTSLALVQLVPQVHAEISLSVNNKAVSIDNSKYAITQDLGITAGNNLFHSFHSFNLEQGETVTFSGANYIENVISRVTGGTASNINGTIRNTIPNANTYLMNPAGILFGEHARLDVQGSFHATTADYLRFSDDGEFYADTSQISSFSAAPIAAFGFLDNPHGAIEVGGRAELNQEENTTPRALLQVPEDESLSLIGGEIQLNQGLEELPSRELSFDDSPAEVQAKVQDAQRYSQLYAPAGRLNLAAVQGIGEVRLNVEGIASTAAQGADIHMQQEAFISTTGASGGNVFIRAGEFAMDNSRINSITLGVQDGGVVDIQADNITLDNYSIISGSTQNTGDGTDIHLTAVKSLRLLNESPLITGAGGVNAVNQQLGDAGHIRLQAQDIEIVLVNFGNVFFSTDTYGTGRGGDLFIQAENSFNMVDAYIQLAAKGTDAQAGKGGNLTINAKTIKLEDGAQIALISNGNTDGCDITVEAETLHLSGQNGFFSSFLSTVTAGQAAAGNITVRADELVLENNAWLYSKSFAEGNAGNIDIQVNGALLMRGASAQMGFTTGIYSITDINEETQGGHAGDITIHAHRIDLAEGALISADTKATNANSSAGNAGNIRLEVEDSLLLSGVNPYGETANGFASHISARSQGKQAGAAGRIQINTASAFAFGRCVD